MLGLNLLIDYLVESLVEYQHCGLSVSIFLTLKIQWLLYVLPE